MHGEARGARAAQCASVSTAVAAWFDQRLCTTVSVETRESVSTLERGEGRRWLHTQPYVNQVCVGIQS